MLITGISGAEFGIRGFIDGWDPETGKQLWRRYTIPARGEKGNETWPQDTNAWKIGGGSSLDHRLLRSRARSRSIGAPAIRRRGPRSRAPGDNLYTSSVLALRPKTGEIVWHYQFTPNDAYDYDASWELILADLDVAGADAQGADAAQPQRLPLCARPHQRRADLGQAIREGQLGEPHRHGDRPTGRDRDRRARCAPARRSRCGRRRAAARTGRMRRSIRRPACSMRRPCIGAASTSISRPRTTCVGQRYQFIENRPTPAQPGEPIGHVDAIDPLTGKPKWRVPLTDHPVWSAMLATGGGLLFTGKETGEFIALDARHRQAAVAIPDRLRHQRQPVTYTHNGPAIRDRAFRHRRAVVERGARATQGQGAARRLGLDVRAAAGMMRDLTTVFLVAALPREPCGLAACAPRCS